MGQQASSFGLKAEGDLPSSNGVAAALAGQPPTLQLAAPLPVPASSGGAVGALGAAQWRPPLGSVCDSQAAPTYAPLPLHLLSPEQQGPLRMGHTLDTEHGVSLAGTAAPRLALCCSIGDAYVASVLQDAYVRLWGTPPLAPPSLTCYIGYATTAEALLEALAEWLAQLDLTAQPVVSEGTGSSSSGRRWQAGDLMLCFEHPAEGGQLVWRTIEAACHHGGAGGFSGAVATCPVLGVQLGLGEGAAPGEEPELLLPELDIKVRPLADGARLVLQPELLIQGWCWAADGGTCWASAWRHR